MLASRMRWLKCRWCAKVGAHGGELGMTQLARVLAGELGLTIGPALAHEFHVLSDVTNLAFDTRVRLVQRE